MSKKKQKKHVCLPTGSCMRIYALSKPGALDHHGGGLVVTVEGLEMTW